MGSLKKLLLLWSNPIVIAYSFLAVNSVFSKTITDNLNLLSPPTHNINHPPASARADTPTFPSFLPPPSLDTWYSPPAGWESTTPGTVLRIRPHAYPTINIRHCRDTFQLLYRSSDTHGNPSWAVTTVFVPVSHPNTTTTTSNSTNPGHEVIRVVSYQVPSDSVSPDAAPSYLLQALEPYGEMRDLLARGWFVAVPDYEGPQASYCAGKQAGYATLDGIRAVRDAAASFPLLRDEFNLHSNSTMRAAIWGYSGGGFAGGFAMELVSAYAPDLIPVPHGQDGNGNEGGVLVGAAVGGPSPNLTTVFQAMNGRDTAGLALASLVGVTMQWPEVRSFMLSRLKQAGPYNATGFLAVEKMSGVQALMAYSKHDVYGYFEGGERDVWDPVMQKVVDADAVMGVHGAPPREVPVFVYKAVADEMSAVEETDELVRAYCAGGGRVLYHRNELGGHNDELWSGRLRTMDFLAHILDDKRSDNFTLPELGCRTENVRVPLDVLGLLPDWWFTGTPRK
jgi:hypothetical protein